MRECLGCLYYIFWHCCASGMGGRAHGCVRSNRKTAKNTLGRCSEPNVCLAAYLAAVSLPDVSLTGPSPHPTPLLAVACCFIAVLSDWPCLPFFALPLPTLLARVPSLCQHQVPSVGVRLCHVEVVEKFGAVPDLTGGWRTA